MQRTFRKKNLIVYYLIYSIIALNSQSQKQLLTTFSLIQIGQHGKNELKKLKK